MTRWNRASCFIASWLKLEVANAQPAADHAGCGGGCLQCAPRASDLESPASVAGFGGEAGSGNHLLPVGGWFGGRNRPVSIRRFRSQAVTPGGRSVAARRPTEAGSVYSNQALPVTKAGAEAFSAVAEAEERRPGASRCLYRRAENDREDRGGTMKTIEYRTDDKSGWQPGPWMNEPDKKQWQDPETGLPCLIVRRPRRGVVRLCWCREGSPVVRQGLHEPEPGMGRSGATEDSGGGDTRAWRPYVCR